MADYSLKPVEEKDEGYTLTPVDDTAAEPSKAFMDRINLGGALHQNLAPLVAGAKAAKEAFGSEPLGLSDQHVKQLMDAGVFRDPATGRGGALRWMNEAAIMPLSVMGDALVRGGQAAIGAVAGTIGQLVSEAPNQALGSGERAKNEIINFANYQLLRGDHEFGRADHVEGQAHDQPIGILPRPADFQNAASTIERVKKTKEQAETIQGAGQQPSDTTVNNLIDLWKVRGIHPAEAAADARTDALLKQDLTTKPYNLTDNSGIQHPTATPVSKGTPRSELARTGDPYVDRILESDVTRNVVDNPVVDRTRDVPYTAGGSVPLQDPTMFIDKHFPREFTIDGTTFDPADPFAIHENVEQHVMDILTKGGMDDGTAYKVAHFEFAEKAEGAWYKAHGIDQAKAEAAYAPYMAEIQRRGGSDFPPNLYKRPYPHDEPSAAHDEAIAEPKPTKAEIKRAHDILDAQEEKPLRAVGGDVTRELPADVDPTRQTRSPVGRMVEAGRKAMDGLFGLGKNIQYMLDPMSVGSDRAMVVAKDAMNSVRRIRYERTLDDQALVKQFKPEQLERMWNALDEESVMRQEGKPSEHVGLATLAPDERAAVEKLMQSSQHAWLHAVDAGNVKGEGLPAYAPRIMVNMATIGANAGPRALNELGRNVFTRTAQMRHRSYLEAEETEAAARKAVQVQMKEAGATDAEIAESVSKVKIARNIRTLPWATARMEEAAIWKTMINHVRDIGKQAGQDTVRVGEKPGPEWFTIAGNPAFTEWSPRLVEEDGKFVPERNENGEIIFTPKPIYMAPEFKGPMTAILGPGESSSVLVRGTQSLYGGLMSLKAKAMTVIMNSPLIHNEVVWSKVAEAVGGRQWAGFRLYSRGNQVAFDKQRAGELIDAGLDPIGKRGAIHDIFGEAEEANIEPGRSWTAKLAGALPGLFDENAGAAVERAIDKMGDFWHNTLLWDRVRDLQFGLADYLSDQIVAKGADRVVADRIASHFANMIIGSIPTEAMSSGARAFGNIALFSRSFTLGNLAIYKQAAAGLPAPLRAQIERDMLGAKKNPETGSYELPEQAKEFTGKIAQGLARRKAVSTLAMSIALYYIGNSLLQNAFNIAFRDSTVPDEMRGYAKRFSDLMAAGEKDPFELRHAIGRLSATYENEPNKGDRAYIGDTSDGTAIYARNPTGKFGEELVGYPTQPAEMLRRKLSPTVSSLLELFTNDKGFGRKIYDTNDNDLKIAAAIGRHLVERQLPEQQMQGAWDLLHDHGDQKLNMLRTFGPAAGFTVSTGAPGGQAKGDVLAAKDAFNTRFGIAWPNIKRQIQDGDIDGAREAMTQIGTPPRMQNGLIRSAQNPGRLSSSTLRDFYYEATPEQIRRFEGHQR